MPMLKMVNVSKTFKSGSDRMAALHDVNLTVEKGEFITIIGSNGAGKSTLFNAISGTYFPDEGNIYLDGKNVTMEPDYMRAKSIGRLFQNPLAGTAPNMSIEENLALASGKCGRFNGISKAAREEFAERLSMLGMGLEENMKKPVGLLSGGQRQALTLLMATYTTPKLLLLDEHTAALDPQIADKVWELTRDIVSKDNLTCLMITHNMQSALTLGTRTVMMHKGSILMDISGEKRANMTVNDLLEDFKNLSGKALDNDRIMLQA